MNRADITDFPSHVFVACRAPEREAEPTTDIINTAFCCFTLSVSVCSEPLLFLELLNFPSCHVFIRQLDKWMAIYPILTNRLAQNIALKIVF